jgi:hypothetical protein
MAAQSLLHTFSVFQPPPGQVRSGRAFKGRPRLLGLQSGLAELMLLNRLRARTRRDLAPDTLERAAAVIEVTARQWFGEARA